MSATSGKHRHREGVRNKLSNRICVLGFKYVGVVACVSTVYRAVSKHAPTTQTLDRDYSRLFPSNSCGIPSHSRFDFFSRRDPLVERTVLESWLTKPVKRFSTVQNSGAYTNVAGPWFEHTNVCVDHVDHVKYFEGEDMKYRQNATFTGASKAGTPHRPIPFPWLRGPRSNDQLDDIAGYVEDSPVYVLKGKSLMLHCWRVHNNPHPLHYLFGYGAVLSVLFASSSEFETLDHVVFHQCPNPYQGGDFHKIIWEIILKESFAKKLFNSETRLYTTKSHQLLCMEHVEDNGWMDKQPYRSGPFLEGPPYMGADAQIFQTWKTRFAEYLEVCRPRAFAILEEQLLLDSHDTSPRIAIFQRQGDSRNGLRRFVNLLEVKTLARMYSKNVEAITVSAETKLEEIVSTFNSFDVLITPHGSQIVNLLFTIKPTKLAVVEVVGSCQHYAFQLWLQHRFVYTVSAGHRSPSHEIQTTIDACEAGRQTTPCGPICADQSNCGINETICNAHDLNGVILSSDLIVDIEKLRTDLELVMQQVRKFN
mmetsp:Transcript_4869/g.17411  ORF Transcript_4869/g.17411 Transcript_4869/m.17411 type:complete len:536 (+) Transcript_4869:359-1966(+)